MSESKKPEDTEFIEPSSPARRAGLFYKLVVPSILQDKKLKIPSKFTKKFGDDLSDLATLIAPDGYEWVLELKRYGRSLWFEDGWHDFVEHHCIQVGQLLVFRYEGSSIFNFYMFNLTAAKNGQCHTSSASVEQIDDKQYPETLGKEAEYTNLMEIFGSCSPDSTLPPSSNKVFHEFSNELTCQRISNVTSFTNLMRWFDAENLNPFKDLDKFQPLQSSQEISFQINGGEILKAPEDVGLQFTVEAGERTRKRKLKVEPIDDFNGPLFYQDCGNNPQKISMALGVQEFKPVHPFCWIVMRQSYVRRGLHLHIPSRFAEKYLKGVSGYITLQAPSGKQWRVRCIREGPGTKLSRGWGEFVVENKLKEEDVCVFELINVKDVVLKVTIFRVFGDPHPSKT